MNEPTSPSGFSAPAQWSWVRLFGLAIGFFVAQLIGYLVVAGPLGQLGAGPNGSAIAGVAGSLLAGGGLIWLFVSGPGRGGWCGLGLRPISSYWLRNAILAAVGCIAVAAALDLLLEPFVGQALVFEPLGIDAASLGFASGAALLACGVLLGPFVEEMLFRGVLYAWLRQRIGVTVAALVSAGIGAAFHLQLAAVFTTFVVFVVFAILYERSGTLWTSVVCHGSYNAAAFGWAIWGLRA